MRTEAEIREKIAEQESHARKSEQSRKAHSGDERLEELYGRDATGFLYCAALLRWVLEEEE